MLYKYGTQHPRFSVWCLVNWLHNNYKPKFNKIPINEAGEKMLRKFGRFNDNVYVVMKPFDINIFKIGDVESETKI